MGGGRGRRGAVRTVSGDEDDAVLIYPCELDVHAGDPVEEALCPRYGVHGIVRPLHAGRGCVDHEVRCKAVPDRQSVGTMALLLRAGSLHERPKKIDSQLAKVVGRRDHAKKRARRLQGKYANMWTSIR